jgi:hypothetical protein
MAMKRAESGAESNMAMERAQRGTAMERAQQHHPRTDMSLRARTGGPTLRVGGAQPRAERL